MGEAIKNFILEAEATMEKHDWGTLRWVSNPTVQGAKQITSLVVHLPKDQGHNFHLHPTQEEVIFVIEGSIEQWIGKEKHILNPGDSVFIPANTVHASFQIGDKEAKLLATLGPCSDNEVGYDIQDMSIESPYNTLRD
ncbi:cupin domain-containing protein [Maribacter algicola]|uniref:Cupin domain-containing protein n=1 Tax=Maribacter algicola TaxID=2498892 RepID=A0A3R8Q1S1_9FLAO|nr:cupin domain-containing protein [Maribacter algicola]RRQ48001.1 cupin domain-containing protein [Maribacter algicola]